MRKKKYSPGDWVRIIFDVKYLEYLNKDDIVGISGKEYQIIETAYTEELDEYEYYLNGIKPWLPEHCLKKKSELFTAIPNREITLLGKQIDEALSNKDVQKFNELSKKYALLKADYV